MDLKRIIVLGRLLYHTIWNRCLTKHLPLSLFTDNPSKEIKSPRYYWQTIGSWGERGGPITCEKNAIETLDYSLLGEQNHSRAIQWWWHPCKSIITMVYRLIMRSLFWGPEGMSWFLKGRGGGVEKMQSWGFMMIGNFLLVLGLLFGSLCGHLEIFRAGWAAPPQKKVFKKAFLVRTVSSILCLVVLS